MEWFDRMLIGLMMVCLLLISIVVSYEIGMLSDRIAAVERKVGR